MSRPYMAMLAIVVILMTGLLAWSKSLPRAIELENSGEKMTGYIRAVTAEGPNIILTIDEMEFLSGEEAIQKGVLDTGCARERISDCIPSLNNDFYIRNIGTSTSEYSLSPKADIQIMQNPGSPELSPLSPSDFPLAFEAPDLLLDKMPFNFLVDGTVITKVEEQYTP
jgi:hypothetical protein